MAQLCRTLLQSRVDQVVVTGDLTQSGKHQQLKSFQRLFAPLLETGRVSLVPGNHDRVGEDAGAQLMHGERVAIQESPGLFLVLVDSTAPHNRSALAAHGQLCARVLEQVYLAFASAPDQSLKVLALHHHLLPLPEESVWEHLASALRLPHAGELALGTQLLQLIRGRCDLVLHGHRHVPRSLQLTGVEGETLAIYNAGSSAELQRVRIFTHAGGRLTSAPVWLSTQDHHPPVRITRPLRWALPKIRPAVASAPSR